MRVGNGMAFGNGRRTSMDSMDLRHMAMDSMDLRC